MGIISLTAPPASLLHQARQLDQVFDPEMASACRHDQVRIPPLDVSPLRRHRTNSFLAGQLEEDLVLAPAMRVVDELELSAGQRMERMNDTETSRIGCIACS
jgi:hypothetical protein